MTGQKESTWTCPMGHKVEGIRRCPECWPSQKESTMTETWQLVDGLVTNGSESFDPNMWGETLRVLNTQAERLRQAEALATALNDIAEGNNIPDDLLLLDPHTFRSAWLTIIQRSARAVLAAYRASETEGTR